MKSYKQGSAHCLKKSAGQRHDTMNKYTHLEAIYLFPSLERALEIAVYGGFLIRPFVHNDYGKERARQDLEELFLDDYLHPRGEIYYEHNQPDIHDLQHRKKGITTPEVIRRTKAKWHQILPTELESPGATNLLMKTAHDKINMSLSDYNNIFRIAQAIAGFDEFDKVQTEHIAEAMHYRMIEIDRLREYKMSAVL